MPQNLSDKLLSWASIADGATVAQAHRLAKMPFIAGHVALMPDAHLGAGATIGSVIPTKGAIIPAAVGVDLGCGMVAAQLDVKASQLPDDLAGLLSRVEAAVPAGLGKGHVGDTYKQTLEVRKLLQLSPPSTALEDDKRLYTRACGQFGTLGSGNHFVEFCTDVNDWVWVMLHSGSRGVGNVLARKHIDKAKGLMKEYFISLEDPDLAYLSEGSPDFDAYIADLRWAQAYAMENRQWMLTSAVNALRDELRRDLATQFVVNCHHNYTAQEHHHGKNIWVTRKGAISARPGEYGIIPSAMGGRSYVVKGLGNVAAYESAPHGAGRMMSRTQARKTLTTESLIERMGDTTWLSDRGDQLLDEHPESYKDIDVVMRDSADLVEVVWEIRAILNYKGT